MDDIDIKGIMDMLNEKNIESMNWFARIAVAMRHAGRWPRVLLLLVVLLESISMYGQLSINPARPAYNIRRIYVSPSGAGTFDGSSWANAAKGSDLQAILRSTDTWNNINSTLQIWVAAGTYIPTEPLSPGDERSASFVLKGNQVVVYGGFRGQVFDDLGALVYAGENSLEERVYGNVLSGNRQEPWALAYQTVFSGDRLGNDNMGESETTIASLDPSHNTSRADNLNTVVTFDPTSSDVVLDGVTITGGSANGTYDAAYGGGVQLSGMRCGLQRCLLLYNFAVRGGAVYIKKNGGADAQRCFVNNSVMVSNSALDRYGYGYGGGIYSEAGVIFNNLIYNNNGGGICAYDATSVVNNTIVNNQLYGIGRPSDANVPGSSITVSNTVVWNIDPLNHAGLRDFEALTDKVANCAIVNWNESDGTDNISLQPYNDQVQSTPNFVNPTTQVGVILEPAYADLAPSFLLQQNSALLSSAESSWMTALNIYYGTDISYDIAGKPRVVSQSLDIGAYQYQPVTGRNILYVRQLSADEPELAPGEVRDGSSWRLALQDVQMAIDQLYARQVIGEVWVAGGTYYPTTTFTDETGAKGNTERHRSFVMRSGISVYGGFRGQTGDEGINNSTTRPRDPNHPDADWAFVNRTIFSGDIDRNDEAQKGWRWNANSQSWEQYYGRNSYHVVWFASEGFYERTTQYEPVAAKPLVVETTLDGVTITGGSANYGERGESTRMGAGVYLVERGVVSNCIIYQNYALTRGGGVMMNNGGTLLNSLVFRNASPGVQVRNGVGGGIYIWGDGIVSRTTVTNNTARVGGGIYVGEAEFNNPNYEEYQSDMYRGVLSNVLVSNNTASSDAGAIYFDRVGGLTSSTVVKNYCSAVASDQDGNSGGMVVDGFGIVYNSVLWGNATIEHTRQFFGENGRLASASAPASIQVYNTALQNLSNTIWGVNTVTQKTYALADQNSSDGSSSSYTSNYPDFTNPVVDELDVTNAPAGVYQTSADDVAGSQTLDGALHTIYDAQLWIPSEYSALQRKGGTSSDAPYVQYTPVHMQFYVPATGILSKAYVEPRVLGAFASDRPAIQYSVIEDDGVEKLVVFVDPATDRDLSGASWNSPMISGNQALEYLASLPATEHPGASREVWVKAGTINPVWRAVGSDRRTSSVVLRGGVSLYGGFNTKLTGTEGSTTEGETFVPVGGSEAEPVRNPVNYRTVFDGSLAGGNLYHVVTMSDEGTAVIDGFHIVNGNASDGFSVFKSGGGILHENGTLYVRNCMIENNMASNGSGIAMLATADKMVMTNTVVNNNTNTGLVSDPLHAAVALQNDARINHCTFIHNNAPAICAISGQLMLYNSVLWGNTTTGTIAANDLQITGMATSLDIRNNAIQYAPDDWALWSDNMQLSVVSGDPMYPTFVNPTRSIGAVSSGYDTPLGGPARFEPNCESPLVIAGDESVVGDPDLFLEADITGHNYVVGGAPDIGAYEATCLNPIGSVLYVRSGPAGTAASPQTTYFGTGDGSSWSNAINGNAWYGFDDGLPYDQIEYDSSDATDYITGLQYAVNMAYKASLKKEADGSIAYTPLNYYELAWWTDQQQTSINIPAVDTTALVEVWVAEGEYTSRRGFFMRDAVQVYGGFPATGTPGKEERNPRVYNTIIQTMTTAEAAQVDAAGENHSLYGPICGFSTQNSYDLNSGYASSNKTRRVLTQPFPYYERTKQGNFSDLSSTELANRPLNPFVMETIWDGFTIQNGRTRINHGKDGGAGVALRKNGRLENCVIRNNINYVPNSTGAGPNDNRNAVQGRGGAAFCNDGVFSNCSFFNNKLGPRYCENYGGAIYMRAGTAYNCVFVGNVANTGTARGSAVYLEVGSFYNNTVSDNSGSEGAIYGGNWFLENGGGASEMNIYNTIVYHNNSTYQIYKAAGCVMTLSRCCVPSYNGYLNNGNLTVEGLINADPQFVDRTPTNKENANYRLQGTSPCINAGNNNPEGITLPETDMDYTDRFKDCSIDIGAYEIDQSEPIMPATKTINGEVVGIIYVTKAANGTVDGSSWANAACEAKLQKALNWAGYIIHNKETYASGKYRDITRIQVRIAAGTYYPTDAVLPDQPRTTTFIIPAGVEVYGGFAGTNDDETIEDRNIQVNQTIFSGMIGSSAEENSYHVVTFGMKQNQDNASVPAEGATYYEDTNPEIALLDGIYLTDGNANHPSDADWQSGGGAKVTVNGLLQNCFVYNCAASDKGGGVYLAPGGRVTGSVIYANESANGGGIYAGDNSMVVNCTVVDNKTTTNGVGGGISLGNKPIILNSVFWMNDSGNGKNIYGNMSQQVDTTFAGTHYESYIFSHCAVEGLKVVGYGNMALTSFNENNTTVVGQNTPGFTDPDNNDFTLKRISSLIRSGIQVEQPDADLMEALHLSQLDMLGTSRYYESDGSTLRDYFDIGALTYDGTLFIDPDIDAVQGEGGVYRLYVSQTAQGLASGHSWRNALGDIQEALDYFANDANFVNDPQAANRQCEIWVSKGTYNPKKAVQEANKGASYVLNRYTSIYGGFRGSNLPYYEGWIETFKTNPSNRVTATGTWNEADYSYTLGGDGAITFKPNVKALANEPSSWFLHFTTNQTSATKPTVTVNGMTLPDKLVLPVVSTDSTTEYIYDLRYLAIGNTDWETAPVIETVQIANLPAGTTLYSATIDNRKSATTTATAIVSTSPVYDFGSGQYIDIVLEDKTESFTMSDQYYAGESFLSERPRQDWNGNGLLEDFEYANESILSGDVGGGSGTAHVAYYGDADATRRIVLDGLKLIKGNTLCADHGGGALCALGPVTLRNCQLLLNESSFGGGAVYASDIEIYGSILGGNAATGKSGGAVYLREGGRSHIVNSVIYNNTAATGSAYYAESGTESQLVNNTIARNSSDESGSGSASTGCTVYAASASGNTLTNTVLWGNDDADCINTGNWEVVTSAADVDESVGNFEVFLDRANAAVMGPRFGFPSDYAGAENYFAMADFSLPSLSTLVNRGTNGGTRKLNTTIQMNPDGSVQSTTITTEPVVLDGSGKGYYAAQNQWGRENVPDTLNSKWRITKEPDTYHIIKQNGVDMIDVKEWKEGVIDIGAYEYESVSLTPFGGNILYVKSTEAVSGQENNGETWEQATSNIYQAIQVLLLSPNTKDKYIKIAAGEYMPYLKDDEGGYSFVVSKPYVENLGNMTKSLTFRGGYPDNITGTDVAMDNLRDPVLYPTYIRGNSDDSKHLFYIDKSMDTAGENGTLSPVYIEGLTFLDGNASDATGEGSTGAAIYGANASTTVRNSVFVSNRAAGANGAAVYLNKGNIYNSVFHTNEAWGIAMGGSGNIISNTIADNTRGGLYGRGATAGDPLQVYNNIIWRNYAGQTPSADDLNHQIDVNNATLYSNAIQIDDQVAEQPNAVYTYWNSSAQVTLGDLAANVNKTLSSDNENMSYGPRFEAPDETEPLNKKFGIRPGRKLINTGYRYMTGGVYNKEENDKWYADLFAYYPFGSVEEPVAAGDSLARVMFVDAGGSRRIAGNSIDIGAYEYQRLFYPNLYVKPDGFGLGSSWDDAMGDLQEAVYSAYYSGDPDESGTYGTVWVAGGDYVLPTTLQWMANVKVYGGFRGTNETEITQRQGLLEENAPNSILSVEAEGVPVVRSDNDHLAGTIVENWAELNGFHIKGGKNSPAVILADSFAITNSVIYDNVNPDGATVESDGLLYNVLLHDNETAGAQISQGDHAAAVHVTAVGDQAQIVGTGKVINSINGTATQLGGVSYAPQYVGDYLPDEAHLRYQLSDRADTLLFCVGELQEPGQDGTTQIGNYTVPKIRNGSSYDDIINLSTDCDVLGNKRIQSHKPVGDDHMIRPDYGCFETWNTDNDQVVNISDSDYPRAGSVVYVGKRGELRLSTALTKEFAPSYLLLRHAAGVRAGNHALSLYNLAIERDLNPLIDASTADWNMVSLPFSLQVGEGTLQNGITIDGHAIEAIQAADETTGNASSLYLYGYDGAKRAEDLYSKAAPQNSKYWTFENNQIGANVGYLVATPSASSGVTVRFSKSSTAQPVYEEAATGTKSLFLVQHNLKNVVNGRPQFTYKENMGWNLFGIPYLCSYTSEQMSIDHILYGYDATARSFVTMNSWEGNTITPFSAVFTQTATIAESEELKFGKPAIPLDTSPAPQGIRLRIAGSNLSGGSDCVSLVADVVEDKPMTFDMSSDALKMMSFDPRVPQMYVYNEDGVRFAHTQSADIEGETPLGVYTGESGIYEIALTDDSDYDRYEAVILTDRATGNKVDLKQASYSFSVDDRAADNGRFVLSFGRLSDEMLAPTFYSPAKRLLRVVNLQGNETIYIYDSLGRQSAVRKASGAVEEITLESGIYVVRIGKKSPVQGKVVVK